MQLLLLYPLQLHHRQNVIVVITLLPPHRWDLVKLKYDRDVINRKGMSDLTALKLSFDIQPCFYNSVQSY